MLCSTRWTRVLPLTIALTAAAPLSGCFGKFALTDAVYTFNKEGVSSDFIVQELLFLAMVIVPVYEIALFVDAIILNPIELFTGSNPVADKGRSESQVVALGEGAELTLTHTRLGLEIVRTVEGLSTTWLLTPGADGLMLLDTKGEVVAETRRLDEGGFEMRDGDGRLLARPGVQMLADLQETWRAEGSAGLAQMAWQLPMVSEAVVAR